MSYVTDVVLLFDIQENFEPNLEDRKEHPISQINNWLEQNSDGKLSLPCQKSNNGNVTGENIWIGSFNHLDTDELVKVVTNQNWRVPASVQLLFKGAEDEKATIIEVTSD